MNIEMVGFLLIAKRKQVIKGLAVNKWEEMINERAYFKLLTFTNLKMNGGWLGSE